MVVTKTRTAVSEKVIFASYAIHTVADTSKHFIRISAYWWLLSGKDIAFFLMIKDHHAATQVLGFLASFFQNEPDS